MKMKYEKPIVAVDRYELSQAIAGCSIRVNSVDSLCFLKDPDVPAITKSYAANGWFTEGNCALQTIAGMNYDGMCYHTQVNAVLKS